MTIGSFAPDLFRGERILITGASSGIGWACAHLLGRLGADLVLSGRNTAKLEQVAEAYPGSVVLTCSLGESGAAADLADKALARGDLAGLVNCAGYGEVKSSRSFSEADIDEHFAVNVRAPMVLSIRIGEAMKRAGKGSIVNISSIQGLLGTPHQIAYTASKGAVNAMTRALARELGPFGVRVNAVAPGLVATEMWGGALESESFRQSAAAHTALRSWASPEMIADVVAFLLSPASAYITGEVLTVDGGLVHTGNIVPESAFGKSK